MRCCISASEGTPTRLTESFCRPASPMCVWASLKPGIAKAPFRSIFWSWGLRVSGRCVGACGQDFSVAAMAIAVTSLGFGGVVAAEADAGEDVAVEVDGVAALGVCGGGEYAEDAEQGCGLHVDESRIVPHFEVSDRSFRKPDFTGPTGSHPSSTRDSVRQSAANYLICQWLMLP